MTNHSAQNQQEFVRRATELVNQMTVEEAASQLRYQSPAIPRLHIPAYNWWNEALHGVARAGTATMFPQPIGLAAMFDDTEVRRMGEIIAQEGRAKYNAASAAGDRDIYKGLTFWGPNVNIFRDPRWGRGHETYGEDPYLTARLGVAYVKGVQGDGPYLKAAACAKHYAVHSGPESLRHEFDAEVTPYDLWDTYLPAFEACVTEGKVEAVMGAYNRTNGEPCCANRYLMQDVLRGQWGFAGHYVSDCGAIYDFHTGHHVTDNITESAALALRTGCDLNCGSVYLHVLNALADGLVTEEQIRAAAVRLFTTRFKLGLFDEECEFHSISYLENDTPQHHLASLEMCRKSLVLLKNDGILPLRADRLKTVGVIGPNADSRAVLQGNYYGTASRYITNLEGICNQLGDTVRVLYSQGCELVQDRTTGLAQADDRISEAMAVARCSDVVILCLGLDASLEGEQGDEHNVFASGDKPGLALPAPQIHLLETICSIGKPVILLLNSGSAVDLRYAQEHCAAILQAWYGGSFGGQAAAEALFGVFSPGGKLPITFYASDEQLPDFCNYSMENRTYRYLQSQPLYPFGYGLSYTRFAYSALTLSDHEMGREESLTVSVTVQNKGDWDSDEVVQIYLKAPDAPSPHPNCSLCQFQRIFLKSGETKRVTLTIPNANFRSVLPTGERVVLPGRYTVFAGGSQPDERSRCLTGYVPLSDTIQIN